MFISIVIPCYNEGQKLIDNINKVIDYIETLNITYEIIGVNDGSTDDTQQIIDKAPKRENVKFISYQQNRGKGHAVKTGIAAAEGDVILFMDADLSTDITAIKTVVDNIDKGDIIIGSRRHPDTILTKKQGLLRKFIGNCCIILTRLITGLKVKDTQCGFKAIKKEVAKQIIQKQQIDRWAFDVEYLYIAHLNKYKIYEIPISWENDEDSKVSPISSSISFFKDLIKLRARKKQYKL